MANNEILDILETKIPLINITIFNIIIAILTLIIGVIIASIVARYIKKAMLKGKMNEILAIFTSRIVRLIIIIFVVITAIGFLGVNISQYILGFAVVSGFILGFAFQQTLGNLAAGFMLAITKPFKVGDYVDMAGESGSVEAVGASTTTLITPDNKIIVLPNSIIWGGAIVNYTAQDKRRIDMIVGIGYSDDIPKAMKVTNDVLSKHKNVLKNPAPDVAVSNLGESSVDLVIRPWVKTSDYWTTKFELTKQIKETFDKEGINIPFPQRDVHLYEEKK